jgi:hypothetical protein
MNILLRYFNAKLDREGIQTTGGNERLHRISNGNRISAVNSATLKNLILKGIMFPHRNIHKYTWTSPDGKNHIQIDHILIRGPL